MIQHRPTWRDKSNSRIEAVPRPGGDAVWMVLSALFLAVTMSAILVPAASAHSRHEFEIGHWYGKSYHSGEGEFRNCVVSLHDDGGNLLLVKIDKDLDLSLGVSRREWKLNAGDVAQADVLFDHHQLYKGAAIAVFRDLYLMNLPGRTGAIEVMRRAAFASVRIGDQTIVFALPKVDEALRELAICVEHGRNTRTKA